MNRARSILELLALTTCVLFPVSGHAADNQCITCHQDPDFFVEYPKLHEYYQQWLDSPHEQSMVTCDDCHGGNTDATSANDAHSAVLPMSDRASSLHFSNQPDTCGQCHSDIRSQFVQSKHYDELSGQRAAPTCTTCHPAMSRRPDYRLIVLNACRNCHGPGNSEELPLVTEQAQNLFHQLNVAEGLLGWTRIHYESREWPEDSREQMRSLDERYQEILERVHQFDLEQTGLATQQMLDELTAVFDEARREFEQRADN